MLHARFLSRQVLICRPPSAVEDGLDKSKYADWDVNNYYQLIYPDDHFEYRLIVYKSDLNKRDLTFTDKGRLLKDKLTL